VGRWWSPGRLRIIEASKEDYPELLQKMTIEELQQSICLQREMLHLGESSFVFQLPDQKVDIDLEFIREITGGFNRDIQSAFSKFLSRCDANGVGEDIPVVLIGGGSRIEGLSICLQNVSKRKVYEWEESDVAVVKGAVSVPSQLKQNGVTGLPEEIAPSSLPAKEPSSNTLSPKIEPTRSPPLPPIPSVEERQPGEEIEVAIYPGVKVKFCWCPATTSQAWKKISGGKDTFTMGSPESEKGRKPDEKQHEVRLTRGFWMGKFPVTQEQWEKVMGNNPSSNQIESSNKGGFFNLETLISRKTRPQHPVEGIKWNNCMEFIHKIKSYKGDFGFRLPTEAEWEYACRAGTTGAYAGELKSMGWYYNNHQVTNSSQVGIKLPNLWNIYDMHGNVWESCSDWYGDYISELNQDPSGPLNGKKRVLRGGSWIDDSAACRSSNRSVYSPWYRFDVGLRLALQNLES